MSEYDEDRIAEVSGQLFALAVKICLLPNGQLDCLTLALAMADITASNASLLPNGNELVDRSNYRMAQSLMAAHRMGTMQ